MALEQPSRPGTVTGFDQTAGFAGGVGDGACDGARDGAAGVASGVACALGEGMTTSGLGGGEPLGVGLAEEPHAAKRTATMADAARGRS
jgi:hypothetical protein